MVFSEDPTGSSKITTDKEIGWEKLSLRARLPGRLNLCYLFPFYFIFPDVPAQEEIRSSCSEPCSWLCHFCALHSCSWEFPASPPLCQGDARPFCSSIPSAKRGVQKLFPGKESWNHLGWKSSSPTTIPALNPMSTHPLNPSRDGDSSISLVG